MGGSGSSSAPSFGAGQPLHGWQKANPAMLSAMGPAAGGQLGAGQQSLQGMGSQNWQAGQNGLAGMLMGQPNSAAISDAPPASFGPAQQWSPLNGGGWVSGAPAPISNAPAASMGPARQWNPANGGGWA